MTAKIVILFKKLHAKVGKRGIFGLLVALGSLISYSEAEEKSKAAIRFGGDNAVQNLMNAVDLKRDEERKAIWGMVLGTGLLGFGFIKYRGRQFAEGSK